ncbi:hypothetical protein H5410_011881 [Solanum commersonii]|uniref:Erythronate-4-phosphate dehydrogenase family protein n=1 Tax=Solanum commersonii TaxID=4109 RepID=A0A9J6ARB4_SOLCO|nr:hypothetical protein H5410_011881 [Solanum commersonii]
MGNQGEELLMTAYKSSNFTAGCLEIRLFYVRIASCAVDMGVSLEINGCRIPSSDTVFITLRRDRVDKGSSEVTYVSTDNLRVSGTVEFEVHEEKDELILCGSLKKLRIRGIMVMGLGEVWIVTMRCLLGVVDQCFFNQRLGFRRHRLRFTSVVLVSPRRKLFRHSMLDSIPEDEGVGKEHQYVNGFIPQQKLPITDSELDYYKSEGKAGHGFYSEDITKAILVGVRVGMGICLGMCVGVGIGVGLLMRFYRATTTNLRRRFF